MWTASFRPVVFALVLLLSLVAGAKTFHVEHNGRLWQWAELVRALDGYIKVVDRGRHSRFWNFMAAWYQSPHVAAAAADLHVADEGVGGAIGDDDDVAGMLAGAAAGAAAAFAAGAAAVAAIRRQRKTPSTIVVDDWVALWIMGKGDEDLGELVIGFVLDLYGPGRRHGYVHLDSADAQTDTAFAKVRIYTLDMESRRVAPRVSGTQFDAFAVKGITRRLVLPPRDGFLPNEEHQELLASLDQIREGARRELKERQEAAARQKEARDAKARAAGREDASKLTVDLMKEELRARKKRNESIGGLSGSRDVLLKRLQEARQRVPNIPDLPPAGVGGGAGVADGGAGECDDDGGDDADDDGRVGNDAAAGHDEAAQDSNGADDSTRSGDNRSIGDGATNDGGAHNGDGNVGGCGIAGGAADTAASDDGIATAASLVGRRLSGTVFDIITRTDGSYPGTLIAYSNGSAEPFLVHYDDGDAISYSDADWEKDIQLGGVHETVRYCKCVRCMSAHGRRGKRIV